MSSRIFTVATERYDHDAKAQRSTIWSIHADVMGYESDKGGYSYLKFYNVHPMGTRILVAAFSEFVAAWEDGAMTERVEEELDGGVSGEAP